MSALLETREGEATGGLSVALSGVSKSFGETSVLRGFDLKVRPGEFLAVVGRSGGGKSTLLRLVAGLDRPSGGRVEIGGRPVAGLNPAVRLLFQEARLVPWQSVVQNVGIARGPGWREAAERALADVGLDGRGGEWPSVLSGGQKQRVALARALVSRPGILLLDEPFGALDALTRIEMHRLLDGIWRARGFTTILITHDVAEAVALADRVIVLREGRIALDVEVELERPRAELADPRAAELQKRILAAV
ncbi:ABC transporter ATP-binding protein [Antarcticirhabdus aurantiaca]|uniref:ATP-binding cassette domain-containing protein n=1 Tax=Antarcticirhabdus aurantiaca TaxID=2606717 RepID=A0ACD4NMN5_9HYPH|nr:ATP-binding cassette domain-containing protein [Antarcticirhabdus aurantiaca]WAJ28116.1 ATP-binding cassette domain-containing protein [Jeongeuplla avenae]